MGRNKSITMGIEGQCKMKKDYIVAKRLDELQKEYLTEESMMHSIVLGAKIDMLEWILREE